MSSPFLAKSFMPTKGEAGVARSITHMGSDVHTLLRDSLQSTARQRTERGIPLGPMKTPGSAANRHPRQVEAAQGRFHDKRQKAWEAKGSVRAPSQRQPKKVRFTPVAAAPKSAVKAKGKDLEAHNPISGRTLASIGATSGVAVGSAYGEHKLRKADDDQHRGARTALGAVAGAAGADAVHDAAGQALKVRNASVRARDWDNKKHRAVWDAHRKAHGISGQVTGATKESTKNALYRHYPKELPGWRGQRALATISHPAVKLGLVGAAATTGAALALHHKKVQKADRRRTHEEEGAAAVVGGGAGQGAYQQAGYSTKHYVDRHTRKGNPGVSLEQVRLQDKVLKPLKSAHHMHLPLHHPDRDNVGYHRNYAKELPHGQTIRVLGHTHEGKIGTAVGAGATVAGAAAGVFGVHHHAKKMASARMTAVRAGQSPLKKKDAMSENPFLMSKATAAATLAPTIGSAASVPKGWKLRTAARGTAGSVAGAAAGGLVGHLAGGGVATTAGLYAGKHVGGYAAYKSSKAVKTGHAYGSKKPDDEVGKRDVVMSGTALVAKAACVCRCGCKDCGGSGDRVKKARCNCSCPTCGGGVHKSAFGVEHEIAKLGLAPVEDAWKGLKVGAAGKSFGAAPGSMSGMLGAKTGNVARKGAMGGANFMRTNPVAGAGTAAGVGAGGGLALSRKGNN